MAILVNQLCSYLNVWQSYGDFLVAFNGFMGKALQLVIGF